ASFITWLPILLCAAACLVGLWAMLQDDQNMSLYVGLPCFGLLLLFLTLGDWPEKLARKRLVSLVRDRVEARGDKLVDPSGPDVFRVEFSPRANWVGMYTTVTDADDRGYLRIDRESRRLLYEGDRFRWNIPADAVIECQTEIKNKESFQEGQQQGMLRYAAVLEIRDGAETRELPLSVMETPSTDERAAGSSQEAADLLTKTINALVAN
ncbi:MAG: hypothetical protein N2C14_11535, partial [Planctomycetales bacterium]